VDPGRGGAGIRLVSWNVRDFLGDPAARRRVLAALAPDVACLQEAPRRPGGGLRIRSFALDCGLRHVAGGRTSGGTALLVAPHIQVRRVRAFRLPVDGMLTRTRGAVLATVAGPDGTCLSLACVHLPLDPGQRVRHGLLTVAVMRGFPGPHAVAGDFNEPPGGPAWAVWGSLAADPCPGAGMTFPAGRADKRLDAVLAGPGLTVARYGDGGADPEEVRRASDHLPVVAVLHPSRTPAARS
jgi:endonuclease/exonuclease/phosphatase family metal-dependent hydrolase